MNIPDNLIIFSADQGRRSLQEPILTFGIERGYTEEKSEEINFTWSITSFESSSMEFQISFIEPDIVSIGVENDVLSIEFKQVDFIQSSDGLTIDPDTKLRKEMTRQISHDFA